jgi:branched-chain amino acid transport system permease protein
MRFSLVQVVIIVTVVALAISLSFIFNKTKFGIMLKAVSQDKSAAWLMGINVRRTAMFGNCLGCGLGGVGGLLLGIYYQNILATMGGSMGMKAFASSVLGGLTDVRFSALGGMIIGVVEILGITVSSASFRDIFAFSFLIVVLIFRPQGFTSKLGEKV